MADKEEKLSPFDQWEADAAQQENEQPQPVQQTEQLVQADPAGPIDFRDQAINEGQTLNSAGVEQAELTLLEESGYVDFDKSPSDTPNQQPNYGDKWESQSQAKPETKQDLDAVLAKAGQALNQAGVETQEQSPFDKWEVQAAQTPEQTQPKPEQQQDQEPER